MDFCRHTRHALWVFQAEIFGKRSLVAFLPSKGDAGIFFGLHVVERFLEESNTVMAVVSNASSCYIKFWIAYSSWSLRSTMKPKPFSVLKFCGTVSTNT